MLNVNVAVRFAPEQIRLPRGLLPACANPDDGPLLEFRQFKLAPGRRDAMINLFERAFLDPKEKLGIRVFGAFRDLDDPCRLTFLTAVPSMAERARKTDAFYASDAWRAHQAEASSMIKDGSNVLLLRESVGDRRFGCADRIGPAGLVVANIHYLWKDASDGFVDFFSARMAPALERAGLPVLAMCCPERERNRLPDFPVREGEKIFVWFTRVAGEEALREGRRALRSDPGWVRDIGPLLSDLEERDSQILRLLPVDYSRLG